MSETTTNTTKKKAVKRKSTAEQKSPASPLAAALARLVRAVPAIAKTGQSAHGYAYLSEGDLVSGLRDAFADEGLVLFPRDVEVDQDAIGGQTRSGVDFRYVSVRCTFVLEHAESGETRELLAVGAATDLEGRALAKAQTDAWKTLLRRLAMVYGAEDDEAKTRRDEAVAKPGAPVERRGRPATMTATTSSTPTKTAAVSAQVVGDERQQKQESPPGMNMGPGATSDEALRKAVESLAKVLTEARLVDGSPLPVDSWDGFTHHATDGDLRWSEVQDAVAGARKVHPGLIRQAVGALRRELPRLVEEYAKDPDYVRTPF